MPSDEILNPGWVEERRTAQLSTKNELKVFHDFAFTDKLLESEISFKHKMVDNSGIDFKGVHYDHGNGLAIADVDGDGFHDLYFVNQVGSNQLWRNKGDGTFEDITKGGLAMGKEISVSASFADTDNDGDQDLFVSTVKFGNKLFENDGEGNFKDITTQASLGYVGHSSGAVFFDYNRDGLLDLFLSNVGKYTEEEKAPIIGITRLDDLSEGYSYYPGVDKAFSGHLMPERTEKSILYKNLGENRFIGVSSVLGLEDETWTGDASPIDGNDDGWPDLYVFNMQGNDSYYENQGGEAFEKKSVEYFPNTPWGSMSAKVFDHNNDGLFDMFISDMHSDMWQPNEYIDAVEEKIKPTNELTPPESHMRSGGRHINGNAFFEKQPDGSYKERSDELNLETYWPWGLTTGDVNADGFEDIFVTGSMNFPFRYAVNSLLLNNQGERFHDSEYILGIEPRRDKKTAKLWFEIDCLEENKTHGVCEEYGGDKLYDVWAALGSRASVIFDLDNDGDLDIVTSDYNSEPMVLISNLSEKNSDLNYLKINLEGKTSNRNGLGAKVIVFAGDNSYHKIHDGVTGYLAHGIQPIYIGLSDQKVVDKIEVIWPSGKKQVLDGPIASKQSLSIVEE